MNEKKAGVKSFFKRIKPEYVLLVAAAVAVIALFLSNYSYAKTQTSADTAAEYVETLEKKLSTELSKIDGAGKVSVIISVSRGMVSELATETTVTTSVGGEKKEVSSPLLVNGKPIILGESYPEICGVVITAQGGDKLKVKMAILNAAQIFLNVDAKKIEILTMK